MEGNPSSRIQISPTDRVMALVVQATSNVDGPDVHSLANLDYYLEDHGGTMWHTLNVTYDNNLAEIYPVLCAIVDRVQLRGDSFADAVHAVLRGLGEILAGRSGLSTEEQVGLFGELAALLSLAHYTNARNALQAWRGPDREEHDFGLPLCDLEIKTTLAEKRTHWINSLTQLTASPGRPLFVVSIQLTAPGAEVTASLLDLVDATRAFPGMPGVQLNQMLEAAGYYDGHADLYGTHWRFRTLAAFFHVDEGFPALTTARLFSSVPASQRVEDVHYRISLEGLPVHQSLFPIDITGFMK